MGGSATVKQDRGRQAAAALDPIILAHQAEQLRRPFLEALPLPGAIVALGADGLELIDGNTEFQRLDRAAGDGRLLARCDFRDALSDFLRGQGTILDLEWIDGDLISGRQYSVRAARLFTIQARGNRCLLTLLDRTAERAAEKNLRLEMFSDSLTGLPNRAGFGDQLEAVLDAAPVGGIAVLALDLTRFSRINESIGDVVGDELLITVARRLLSTMRAGDVLARTGGNEFGVFVSINDGPEEVLAVAERINAVLAAPCRLSELEIRIGCAIGCAVHAGDCTADELIRRAQFALKRAKTTGATELYQPRALDIARQQFTIETCLRRAIEAERLTLAYQPVIELRTGRVCGFEALARWREGGVDIPPSTFIPVAEESGLVLPLGRWALAEAMRTLGSWDRRAGAPMPVSMAVNVSAIQVARDDVPAMLEDAIRAHKVAPERIALELTESAIVADPDRAAKAMDAVRSIGATIALDDFGTGYSNLAYLQRLPIDVLKIDKSFVTGMLGDRDKVAIVRAILSLAQALGLGTTAEGVETPELSQTLAALGCTLAQGYHYAAPLDADAAFAYWSRNNSAAT
ncbi:EAL domain-containing protein [Sphingomonas sp. MAH-20]|uniref:EAL domain-containing protein n=1 Tax=Sphingomonas horti TaxID=2682842 RepID=A0A6I4J8W5_9SPHN|nr:MULTISPECIES: bifunctional diguanylate cyclase/phosphodiesterase [Sphingomonas]MBA2919228.1 bifunctional diguanylate cyclase/phosphodiesterase [Sphingomonas sp. CGMCC 1.13658]MVO79261.1 EAL domain-containing protein [Sphingomonas horti]